MEYNNSTWLSYCLIYLGVHLISMPVRILATHLSIAFLTQSAHASSRRGLVSLGEISLSDIILLVQSGADAVCVDERAWDSRETTTVLHHRGVVDVFVRDGIRTDGAETALSRHIELLQNAGWFLGG
jgi:hypothetical protein